MPFSFGHRSTSHKDSKPSNDNVLNIISPPSTANTNSYRKFDPHSSKSSSNTVPTIEEKRSVLGTTAFSSLFQLSEEYNSGVDRLDKNQLAEEQNMTRNVHRRNSMVKPDVIHLQANENQRPRLNYRRNSIAISPNRFNGASNEDSNANSIEISTQNDEFTTKSDKISTQNEESTVKSSEMSTQNSDFNSKISIPSVNIVVELADEEKSIQEAPIPKEHKVNRVNFPVLSTRRASLGSNVYYNHHSLNPVDEERRSPLNEEPKSDILAGRMTAAGFSMIKFPSRRGSLAVNQDTTSKPVAQRRLSLSHKSTDMKPLSKIAEGTIPKLMENLKVNVDCLKKKEMARPIVNATKEREDDWLYGNAPSTHEGGADNCSPSFYGPADSALSHSLSEELTAGINSEGATEEDANTEAMFKRIGGQRRRSSVTFKSNVDEIKEEPTKDSTDMKTIRRIDSIDEDEPTLEDEVKGYGKVEAKPGKRIRSMSLYPSSMNAKMLRDLKLESVNSEAPPCTSSGSSRKGSLNPLFSSTYNIRSDSVDSGFSCASLSSNSSSSESSNEEPNKRRASIAIPSITLSHGTIQKQSDIGDYPSWVKSIKKLVQLTVEFDLKNGDEEMKEKDGSGDLETNASIFDNFVTQHKILENVKKFIRHNDWPISHEIRADLWRVLCHNKDFEANKRLYNQQLEDLTKSGVKSLQPSFLSADGVVVHDHGLKEPGAVTLQRLIIVIECVRPEIGYVPILYPLCAMFLHYMSAEETFACMLRLLSQQSGGTTYILQSELAIFASCHTLLSLLKKHKKAVYSMLKRRAGTSDDTKLAEVFTNWNAWIFKHMPFDYLVRVVDCFLVEGHKMLLRVVFSLVYIWYKERTREKLEAPSTHIITTNTISGRFPLLRSTTVPGRPKNLSNINSSNSDQSVDQRIVEINDQIVGIAQNCPISVQTLLDMGCSIRNFKHTTFEHRQKRYENKFRDEVNRRRAEKSLLMGVRPTRSIFTTAAFASKIVDAETAGELICALPTRFQLETPELIFRLSEHGASFVQMWSQIDDAEQTLLIIRSTRGDIFGAYCSSCWSERRDVRERAKTRYFGTGESFVWHLHEQISLPVIHAWAGRNSDHPDSCPQMFMTAGDKYMIIGSSGEGDAIAIRDELDRGLSYPCDTFASPSLVSKGNEFEIDELEVFSVVSSGGHSF